MSEWHSPGERCQVCFAGAVMAQTCGAELSMTHNPWDFGEDWDRCFRALDCVRRGDVDGALSLLGHHLDHWQERVVPYSLNPELFKSDVRRVIYQLKKKGL